MCGSTRFKEDFERVNKELTLAGNIVLSVGVYIHLGDYISKEYITDDQKIMLDDMHKITTDMADEILVINKGGYIGDSTKSEIEYAIKHNKKVLYLEPVD